MVVVTATVHPERNEDEEEEVEPVPRERRGSRFSPPPTPREEEQKKHERRPTRKPSIKLFDGNENHEQLDQTLKMSMDEQPRFLSKSKKHEEEGNTLEEVQRIRERIRDHSSGVLNPKSKIVARWDGLTFTLLIYTAFVTPFEVAFVETKTRHGLFWINRFVDVVFITDIAVQFSMAYTDESRGSMLIKSKSLIAKRYLNGWFTCDVASSIPVDVLSHTVPNGQQLEDFKAFRLIRLLRLLKLLRVIKASRMLARYETEFALSYAHLALMKHFMAILVTSHWVACVWGMTLQIQGDEEWTWIDALEVIKVDGEGRCLFDKHASYDAYIRSLYFSVYVLTGIGLGDITAQTNTETLVATLCMILSAVFWAYTIGNFCSIVSVMDRSGVEFRQSMDELNHMLEDRKFPRELRQRCRMFLMQSREQHRIENYRHIEKHFSAALRLEVAVANNGRWLKKVWYLHEAPSTFIAELSQLLVPATFAPMEIINLTFTLFILRRGICARKGRVLAKGSVWGEDFILDNDELVDNSFSAALTYVEVLYLRHAHFIELAHEFPDIDAKINKAKVFYAVRARLAAMGRLRKRQQEEQQQKSPRLGLLHHLHPPTTPTASRSSSQLPTGNISAGISSSKLLADNRLADRSSQPSGDPCNASGSKLLADHQRLIDPAHVAPEATEEEETTANRRGSFLESRRLSRDHQRRPSISATKTEDAWEQMTAIQNAHKEEATPPRDSTARRPPPPASLDDVLDGAVSPFSTSSSSVRTSPSVRTPSDVP